MKPPKPPPPTEALLNDPYSPQNPQSLPNVMRRVNEAGEYFSRQQRQFGKQTKEPVKGPSRSTQAVTSGRVCKKQAELAARRDHGCPGSCYQRASRRAESGQCRRAALVVIFDRLLPPGLGQTGSRAPRSGDSGRRRCSSALRAGCAVPSFGGRSARDPGAPQRLRGAPPNRPRVDGLERRVLLRHRAGDVEQRQVGRQRGSHGLVLAAWASCSGSSSAAGRGSGRPGRSRSAGPTR